MRILVTGSRDWPDAMTVWNKLGAHAHRKDVVIVHGDCPSGADWAAREWCRDSWNRDAQGLKTREERHPADWSLGRKAGPLRNMRMVDLGADLCLAFISDCTSPRCKKPGTHPSHGASGCADLAERAGIPTLRTAPRKTTAPHAPDRDASETRGES